MVPAILAYERHAQPHFCSPARRTGSDHDRRGRGARDEAATAAAGYEEVKGWPTLPAGVEMGEAAGVAVDGNGHVMVFHRPGRGFDTAATELLKDPAVLEIDPQSGRLLNSWGANTFLVPHGITIDQANNVFLTDVALQQVFKFSHDGTLSVQRRRAARRQVGRGAFQSTDRHRDSRRTARSMSPTATSTAAVAMLRRSRKWLREWGKKGAGHGRVQQSASA
jgi:peptidylamidoglycolate lyase